MYNLVPDCKSVIGNCTTWWWYRSIRGNRCCLGGLLSHQYLSVHSQTGLVPRFSCCELACTDLWHLHHCSSVAVLHCCMAAWWHGGMGAWWHGGMGAWWHHSGHSRIGHSHWSVMPTLVRSPTSRTSRPIKNGLGQYMIGPRFIFSRSRSSGITETCFFKGGCRQTETGA